MDYRRSLVSVASGVELTSGDGWRKELNTGGGRCQGGIGVSCGTKDLGEMGRGRRSCVLACCGLGEPPASSSRGEIVAERGGVCR
jgi:hypothetical protein